MCVCIAASAIVWLLFSVNSIIITFCVYAFVNSRSLLSKNHHRMPERLELPFFTHCVRLICAFIWFPFAFPFISLGFLYTNTQSRSYLHQKLSHARPSICFECVTHVCTSLYLFILPYYFPLLFYRVHTRKHTHTTHHSSSVQSNDNSIFLFIHIHLTTEQSY